MTKIIKEEYKIILMGDGRCGKSTFSQTEIGIGIDNPQQTIGAAFVSFEKMFDKEKIKLIMWDTAGNIRYRSLISMYCRGADLMIICVDLSIQFNQRNQIDSFQNIIHPVIDKNGKYVVLGMKYDQKIDETVEKVRDYCQKNNINYY